MDILEILYSREFKSINYNVRKVQIDGDKTLLLGPRGSGKSTIIFDHLSHRKKGTFLYIDLKDLRLNDIDIFNNLQTFIDKNQIKLIILENFNLNFKLPTCDEIIITADHECDIDGFIKIKIFPLDFEEFISFDKRELNIEAIFNSYATNGTYPAMYAKHKDDFAKLYQNYLNTIYNTNKLEIPTLQILSAHQGRVVSMFELFNQLKKSHKISKDKFYELIKKFQTEYVLFFVEKFGSSRATKKLFMIDFTIRSALNFDKDFIKRFENIIFLELLKRDKNIFYTDAIDFYLPDEEKAILTIPFLPINLIKNKIQRLDDHFEKLDIKNIQIVTMGESGEFSQNGITCELLPFWSFATLL